MVKEYIVNIKHDFSQYDRESLHSNTFVRIIAQNESKEQLKNAIYALMFHTLKIKFFTLDYVDYRGYNNCDFTMPDFAIYELSYDKEIDVTLISMLKDKKASEEIIKTYKFTSSCSDDLDKLFNDWHQDQTVNKLKQELIQRNEEFQLEKSKRDENLKIEQLSKSIKDLSRDERLKILNELIGETNEN